MCYQYHFICIVAFNFFSVFNSSKLCCFFLQETTVTLTFRMLDKVTAPELVAKCLECTVRPYMSEHKLDEDETLLRYIKACSLFFSACKVEIAKKNHTWSAGTVLL